MVQTVVTIDQVEPVYDSTSITIVPPCLSLYWQEVQDRTDEGFLGCMHNKFDPRKGKFLVVLDGCSPYFVNEEA